MNVGQLGKIWVKTCHSFLPELNAQEGLLDNTYDGGEVGLMEVAMSMPIR